jgi:Zn-dependent protease with chaperone function
MRAPLLFTFALLAAAPASAQEIIAVLARSQEQRLSSFTASGNSERAAIVRASYEKLAAAENAAVTMELRVVSGVLMAECLHGRVIVANERLAELPEGVRLFILAHEIAHAALGHYKQLGALYARHIPGEVVQQKTDAVAGALGRDASAMSHDHEYTADLWAWESIRGLGFDFDSVVAALRLQGMQMDSATHPGTRRRIAQLRVAAEQ